MFHSLLLVTKFTYPVLCFFTLNKVLLSPVWPKWALVWLFSASSSCPSRHTYFSLNSVIASCSFFIPLLLPHLFFYLCLIMIFISLLLKGTVISIWLILVASIAHVSAVSFPMIWAGIHANVMLSPIIWILNNVCWISIKTSGLLSKWLCFKLIQDKLVSEHIAVLKGRSS